ncbi:chemotaxis protein CheB [Xanthomonas campestris]|uniref:chemotaxis protein CheB n=1 Tax=Xanthomonas campestris TaxID=339 RepID=UPI002B222740|nr:chemotaxis protein CheB [Xanthomonas campestris]MEA9800259.1 chemotaxis protein CheB [Xanthomonas campestris pv. raphani]MEA9833578.1 chemotaxis protein CheB [Xanthomonas campestris pv. raphani]MEA9922778.1 chemotaxis protein CheB [Xanthomonas campestris pv. raphani]MEA9947202.1 chemotaxis protein CheB [Xanthomonas campestris pv. raphani]MEA9954440.1 chemotaxis protein CheB [Xanthomonas campestris pv. raphani]
MTIENNRNIVAIGGSAGASQALRTLLADLPRDLPAAVLVVLHLSPQGTGIVEMVRSAVRGLPVHVASDGMPLVPGAVYVAVPDSHLMVDGMHVVLGRGPRENMSRPSIDALFRSVAVSHGARALGVLLSGMLNDGCAGLEAIQACGGAVAVQDPDDAIADDMPRNALRALTPDVVAPSAALGAVITDLVREPAAWPIAPSDALRLEVAIARGQPSTTEVMTQLGEPVALSCPACGGVLTKLHTPGTLRFRCQVGHGYTAPALMSAKEGSVDEALRVALRVIEERAELVSRMAGDDRAHQPSVASLYAARAKEYRGYADVLRSALLTSLQRPVEHCALVEDGALLTQDDQH